MCIKLIYEVSDYKFRGHKCKRKAIQYIYLPEREVIYERNHSFSSRDDRKLHYFPTLGIDGMEIPDCEQKIIRDEMYVDEEGDLCLDLVYEDKVDDSSVL